MNRIITVALLSTTLWSCVLHTPNQASINLQALRAELTVNLEKWQSAKPQAYHFTYKIACFCDEDALREVRIYVVNDAVDRVVFTDDGSDAPLENYETMDGYFTRALLRGHLLGVRFDPHMGYLTSSYSDSEIIFDISHSEKISNLQPTP